MAGTAGVPGVAGTSDAPVAGSTGAVPGTPITVSITVVSTPDALVSVPAGAVDGELDESSLKRSPTQPAGTR